MSLRARLTLLNIGIVGGFLLLFGTAIYFAVSITLTNQIESTLERAATQIIRAMRIDLNGQLALDEVPELDLTTDVYIQVWTRDGRLISVSLNLRNLAQALDPRGVGSSQPSIRDAYVSGVHMRVFTVPLIVGNSSRVIGTLQVAASLAVVDATQRMLLIILVVGVFLSMTAAGMAVWISTSQALKPLKLVTQTALQITRADDLSRRIPYRGPPDDEVGQLINAFNQTLSRLENLFNSQRRFLADVGHELRTPLTVIKGNVDLMRRMGGPDDESLDSIESEADRLARLVGDILLLAQAESGKLPLVKRIVELDTLLLEVMQQMRVLAKDRVTLRLGEIDQVLVCGDQDRLKQVLVNLIGNAVKYTPVGGDVVVSIGKTETKAHLTVSDNGAGIAAEEMPYIFERFYRGEKSRTRSRDGKGFGLGLSIAYWIVRNHGGQIEVTPNEPQGTNFRVWLPLAEGECAD